MTAGLAEGIGRTMGDVLRREPLRGNDDFFDCGGDSLRAVDLIARLVDSTTCVAGAADRLRAALLAAVFEEATPASLAAVLAREGTTAS